MAARPCGGAHPREPAVGASGGSPRTASRAGDGVGGGSLVGRALEAPALVTRLATPTYLLERLDRVAADPGTAFIRRLERDQAARSAGLLAPSSALADRVAGDWALDRARIRVIPNPIDGDAVRSAGRMEPVVDLPDRFVAFIGRLERRKGVAVLAQALPTVLADHPDLHMVFVGPDAGAAGGTPAARLMEDLAPVRERVQLVGGLDRQGALSVLARATRWPCPRSGRRSASWPSRPWPSGCRWWPATAAASRRSWNRLHRLAGAPRRRRRSGQDAIRAGRRRRRARSRPGRRAAEGGAFEAAVIAPRLVELLRGPARRRRESLRPSIYAAGYRRHFRPEERGGPFRRSTSRSGGRSCPRCWSGRERIVDVGAGPGRLSLRLPKPTTSRRSTYRRRCWGRPAQAPRRQSASCRPTPASCRSRIAVRRPARARSGHTPPRPGGRAGRARARGPPRRHGVFDTTNSSPWWVLAYPSYVNWRPAACFARCDWEGCCRNGGPRHPSQRWRGPRRHRAVGLELRGEDVRPAMEREVAPLAATRARA